MKRILCTLAIALILLSVFTVTAHAQSRLAPEGQHYVRVETNPLMKDGAHTDKVYVPYGETCTFTMDDTITDFVFWNIHGEYEIVAGDYEEKSFTIRPLSDIVAVATYQEAVPHITVYETEKPPDMTSPQTGDTITPALIALLVIGLVYLGFAIWYAIAMSRLCKTNRRNKR